MVHILAAHEFMLCGATIPEWLEDEKHAFN
jgi:hypothetical protein